MSEFCCTYGMLLQTTNVNIKLKIVSKRKLFFFFFKDKYTQASQHTVICAAVGKEIYETSVVKHLSSSCTSSALAVNNVRTSGT